MTIRPIREIQHPQPTIYPRVCFLSMAKAHDYGYHCAYREFAPSDPTKSSAVRYIRYDDGLAPVGPSMLLRDGTEDPRVFIWKDHPYAWVPDYLQSPWGCGVIDLITHEYIPIVHPLEYSGKNWMPVPDGERLYFIRSVDPLCVLESDDKFRCKIVVPPSQSTFIGSRHGGCSATMKNGIITGYGHRTIYDPRLEHWPYLFSIDLATKHVDYSDPHIEGFGDEILIDPSADMGDGKFLAACAARQWELAGSVPTRLCEIDK